MPFTLWLHFLFPFFPSFVPTSSHLPSLLLSHSPSLPPFLPPSLPPSLPPPLPRPPQVEATDFYYSPRKLHLSPSTAQIPDISPDKYT